MRYAMILTRRQSSFARARKDLMTESELPLLARATAPATEEMLRANWVQRWQNEESTLSRGWPQV